MFIFNLKSSLEEKSSEPDIRFPFSGHRISEEQENTGNGAADWNKNSKGKVHEWAGKSSHGCV